MAGQRGHGQRPAVARDRQLHMGVTSVAVIGLGRMGLPIARNLLERGFTVSGYHRTPGSELAGTGASLARSAAGGAAHADVLLSIVPDADAVDEVDLYFSVPPLL